MKHKILFIVAVVGILVIVSLISALPKSTDSRFERKPIKQKDCCLGENYGAIEGYVYDTKGMTVAGATVYVERIDVLSKGSLTALSDKTGKFTVKGLSPGTYLVSSSKEKDGFPKTTSTFYYGDQINNPEVIVYEQLTTPDVKVALGPKLGRLVFRVVDAETHKPLRNFQLTLRHTNNPNYFFSTAGDIRGTDLEVFAPPVPVTVEISADGYKTVKLERIEITKEEKKKLEVSLQPDKVD